MKKALITAGHKRLGRAIALALAEAGFDVAIQYRRDPLAAEEVVAAAHALGRRAIALQAELTDSAALPRLAAAAAGAGYFAGDPAKVVVAPGLGANSGLLGALAVAVSSTF